MVVNNEHNAYWQLKAKKRQSPYCTTRRSPDLQVQQECVNGVRTGGGPGRDNKHKAHEHPQQELLHSFCIIYISLQSSGCI